MSLKIEISDTTVRARRERSSHGVRTRLRWALAAILAVGSCAAGAFFASGAPSVLPWLENVPPGAALLGASLMVAFGVLSLEDAFRAIDLETITLLLGMMIVVANLRLSGFFRLVGSWAVTRARHPLILLVAVVAVAGSLSAFLVNDTICIVMTPIVLDIVMRLKRDPVPYLL